MAGVPSEQVEAGARAWARGFTGVEAGVDLLFTDGYWPARADFVESCLYRPTWTWVGDQDLVVVEFDDAIDALDAGLLRSGVADACLLRVAAWVAGVDAGPWHLLTEQLDAVRAVLVAHAMTRAFHLPARLDPRSVSGTHESDTPGPA